ncbi:hypothetical protein PsYK624_111300 [Phanerochaete sordida]|uniref:Uncharacterized protein n=1 Tax=Phanerochaete sordida TaxID=48140 RepID=A0A9P3GK19_9APHY|nr:hypothetical protein PsYK624_111300 [Phanerochaete sordida]
MGKAAMPRSCRDPGFCRCWPVLEQEASECCAPERQPSDRASTTQNTPSFQRLADRSYSASSVRRLDDSPELWPCVQAP